VVALAVGLLALHFAKLKASKRKAEKLPSKAVLGLFIFNQSKN